MLTTQAAERTTLPLTINGERLWASLMELAQIGATPKGGVRRLALTELDGAGRDLFVRWCRDAGLAVRVDPIGNIFARRAGSRPNLPPVVSGSHLDTQPSGGKFDGCYGVLAALEAMRTLNDNSIVTRAPVEVAVWTNEEGSRFLPVMAGSGVFAGKYALDDVLAKQDLDGVTVSGALKAIGYDGNAPLGTPIGAYFEVHIEQGPVLEDTDKTIGVVTGCLGQRWYNVYLTGMEAHAGPTPMHLRQDSLLGAAHVIQAVNRIARLHPDTRGTVGFMKIEPNSRNVIPGKVWLSVDLRAPTDALLSEMDRLLHQAVAEACTQHHLTSSVENPVYFPPTPFAPSCVQAVRNAALARGYSHQDIVSGAGHDATYIASVAPTGMIFIPCKDGISHNEIEDALPEHITAGANVLFAAMLEAAGRES